MDLSGRSTVEDQSVVETVEVVSGGSGERVLSPGGTETTLKIINPTQLSIPSSGIIEIDPQALSLVQMTGTNFDVSTVTPLSLAAVTQASSSNPQAILSDIHLKNKRPLQETIPELSTPEVPRKKSRNYLDSHKSIEKKRRDRINNGLTTLKEMVPNCRQYVNQGNKKLDKAEVLEMTIDYIHRLHAQAQANGRGNVDLETSQREWINDLMSWIFHNKMLYSGPGGVDAFANALLLHLQSLSSTPNSTGTGLMYNQFPTDGGSTSEDESITTAHNTLLQQLASTTTTTTAVGTEGEEATGEEQLTTVNKETPSELVTGTGGEGEEEEDSSVSTVNQQQTQLAQLQALLLLQQQQMFQNQQQQQEGTTTSNTSVVDTQQIQQLQQLHQLQTLLLQHLTNEKQATPTIQDVGGEVTVTPTQSVMVTTSAIDSAGLGLTSALDTPAVFSSEETGTLTEQEGSQMWSQTEQHVSSLLIEGGGVQEEVELLEQEH